MDSRLYEEFLHSKSKTQWRRIGALRRTGVLAPLFSIYSKHSVGVGEFSDLSRFAEWCRKTGISILQLLPMNDTGMNFRPYDSESSFALEPMYLDLEKIAFVPVQEFKKEVAGLRARYASREVYFDRSVKEAKTAVLRLMFEKRSSSGEELFEAYIRKNESWLGPYAMFKRLKEVNGFRGWMDWPAPFRDRQIDALTKFGLDESDEIRFVMWVQWQCFLQLAEAKKECNRKGVFLFGDLPFLVSLDSADVWADRRFFKLDLSAGAPPDLYFSGGQEWGMPPYDWQAIEKQSFLYLVEKLKYAEHFYDLFRIDHFVGIFRVWTFPRGVSDEEKRARAAFDPADESLWEEQGRKIVSVITENTSMLACAEDLGCVPACSHRVLADYGIPGMDVQRWMRHWETTGDFKDADEYRPNSISVISTHDMSPLSGWWQTETTDEREERENFWRHVELTGPPDREVTPEFAEACLRAALETNSVFSIQILQDWMLLEGVRNDEFEEGRINRPGSVDEKNWRLRSPYSIEEMMELKASHKILHLNRESGRAH